MNPFINARFQRELRKVAENPLSRSLVSGLGSQVPPLSWVPGLEYRVPPLGSRFSCPASHIWVGPRVPQFLTFFQFFFLLIEPADNYLFTITITTKVNNNNTRTKCEICSKLTIRYQNDWRRSNAFIVNFEHISYVNVEQVNVHC